MHRLTARLLLILTLAGTFTPVAFAISAPAPHACCMRKPMHEHGSNAELRAAAMSCNHDCCHALTVSHAPHLLPSAGVGIGTFSTRFQLQSSELSCRLLIQAAHSGRAPPQVSIA
jgi:hypothetical protein